MEALVRMVVQAVKVYYYLQAIFEIENFKTKFRKWSLFQENGAAANGNTNSPEEILKRKRQMVRQLNAFHLETMVSLQNNEAAARYRKRQREEKEKQHTVGCLFYRLFL